MKTQIKYGILSMLLLPLWLHGQNQNILTDANTETGTQTHVACKEIIFAPGYNYTPISPGDRMQGYIDPSLLCEENYGGSGRGGGSDDGSGTTNINIDQGLPVGCIAGSFSVGASGAANYNISLVIPPGSGGMKPNIGIAYNSQGGNGFLGLGFNLTGLSAISRIGQTIYNDGQTRGVNIDVNDRFSLDGQRLILTNDNTGEFHTESESFMLITANGTTGNGPSYFTVQTKEGMTLEYGNIGNSQVLAQGKTTVLTWLLDKVTDVNGNYMTITYHNDNSNGEWWPETIQYTGNANAGLSPYNVIHFYYNKKSSNKDNQFYYVAGSKEQQTVLLDNIQITSNGQKVHEYDFNYTFDKYSRLVELKEIGADEKAYNSTVFNWGDGRKQDSLYNNHTYLFTNAALRRAGISQSRYIGDFNGDGAADILVAGINPDNTPADKSHWVLYSSKGLYYQDIDQTADDWHLVGNKFDKVTDGTLPTGFADYVPSGQAALIGTVVDMDGDGKEDILLKKLTSTAGNFNYAPYFSTGTGFNIGGTIISPATTLFPHLIYNSELLGDFDGDGKTDLIIVSENYTASFSGAPGYPPTNEHTTITFLLYNDLKNSVSPVASPIIYDVDGDARGGTYRVMDFDGDGIADIYTKIQGIVYIRTYDPGSSTFAIKVGSANISFTKFGKEFMGDFNGDRHTDILAFANGNWTIQYSTGNPSSPFDEKSAPSDLPGSLPEPNPNGPTYAQEGIVVADFNGDGYADILNINNYSGSCNDGSGCTCYYSELAFFINTFNNTFSSKADHDYIYTSNTLSGCSQSSQNNFSLNAIDAHWFNLYNYNLGDFDGDGAMELECFYGGAHGYEPGSTTNASQWVMHHVFFSRYDKSRMLTSIIDGHNKRISIDYDLLSSSVNVGNANIAGKSYTVGATSATFPVAKYRPSLYLVNESKILYGNNAITTDYTYNDALFHLQGKGFLGFSSITSNNTTTGISSTNNYDINSTYYFSMLSSTTVKNGSSAISSTSSTYTTTGTTGSVYFTYPSKIESVDNLTGITTTTTSTLNSNGNLTNQTTNYGTDKTTTTTNTFEQKGAWIESRLTGTTISTTYTGQAAYSRNSNYTNDNLGRLTTITQDVGATTTIFYDIFGNTKTTTTTGVGIAPRSLTNTYDTYGRFVTKQTNGLNQSVTMTYNDAYGNVLSEKDINDLTTTHTYDGFGRLGSTTLPTSQKKTITRNWDNSSGLSNGLFFITTSQDRTAPVTEYYDILGRLIRKQTLSFAGTNLNVDKEYNALGQLSAESNPYIEGQPMQKNQYKYNSDLRLNKVTMASGSVSTYSYGAAMPTTTITTITGPSANPVTHTSSKTLDATGAVVKATDDGGSITYTYHSCGKPKSITVPGTSKNTTMTYDAYGRQLTLSDPDAGTTTYTYDILGELLTQQDAKQVTTFSMTYDALGRILTKKGGPEGDVSYVYDTQTNGKGQLSSISVANGASKTYTYDNFSRLKSETETIDNTSYTTSYTYDKLTRMVSMTYPSGFQITQNYNDYGYLEKVINGNTTIWQTNDMNAYGEVTTAKYGNGSTMSKTYDNLGFLQEHDIQGAGASALQRSYVYTFDATIGNLRRRGDLSMSRGLIETFTYDNLDRLKTTSGVTGAALAMDYGNASGSIKTKSDVGTYGYSTSQPHAVTTISNPLNDTLKQNITYTTFNKVASINTASNGLMLTYGPDEQRCKAIYSSIAGGVPTTYQTKYYSGSYEKTVTTNKIGLFTTTTTRQLDYIAGSDGLCALHVNNSVAAVPDSLYYIYTDHLGSIILITDEKGNIADERSFDAWGRQRNPRNWTYTNVSTFKITDRGYTGHEHLNMFGLINMNGRCYDPWIARMLSPDNYNQAPDNTQAFNRYSYCLNNPLKYTDPSGDLLEALLFPFAFAADFTSNLIFGIPDAAGTAFNYAKNVTNDFVNNSTLQLPVYNNNNTTVNIGLDPFNIEASVSVSHRDGDFTENLSVGYGLGGGFVNGGVNYTNDDFSAGINGGIGADGSPRIGGGATLAGITLGTTYFGGKNAQFNWIAGYRNGDFSIATTNDVGLGGDKYRTAALDIGIGKYHTGFSLYSNDAGIATDPARPDEWSSPIYGCNGGGRGSYLNGQRKYSAFYAGYDNGVSVSRIGVDAPFVQDLIQNGIHRYVSRSPYFRTDYGTRAKPYFYNGSHNPYSLY